MSGCGTDLKGRALVEVYENGMSIQEYDYWVRNYKNVQRSIALGRMTPEQADWSKITFYIKEADSFSLAMVCLETDEQDGQHHVWWSQWDHHYDGEVSYKDENGESLSFTFDPYEGLEQYTMTIVARDSADDPMPEGWTGWWMYDNDCPIYGRQHPADFWPWVDSHSIDKGVSADILVTPGGVETGVPAELVIATRVVAFEKPKGV